MARNIPPGMFRKEFAFEKWKDFDAELFEAVYNEDYEKPFEHRVYASDIVNINIKVSEVNAKNAGVLKDIEFKTIDFASYEPQSENGLLIINPPNGERASDRMVVPLFNMIGDQLKKNYAGFKAWVISSSEEGLKSIDLNPTRKIKLHIGPLECSLQLFEVYDGYKKMKRTFDRPQTQSRGGERREGFRSNTDRGEFNPRERSDFKPRDNGDYKSRDRSDFKPRERGEFKPRDNKDFKPSEGIKGVSNRENREPLNQEKGEILNHANKIAFNHAKKAISNHAIMGALNHMMGEVLSHACKGSKNLVILVNSNRVVWPTLRKKSRKNRMPGPKEPVLKLINQKTVVNPKNKLPF